jgi:PhnB protein
MTMKVQPYLFFGGRCEEAMNFYSAKLGAKVLFMKLFKDAPPDPNHPVSPDNANKVMHATIQIGESVLMCSDGDSKEPKAEHKGYSLSLNPETVEEGQKLFTALGEGGEVTMPFQKTFWAVGFGMLKDKFGVHWMVSIEAPNQKN